MSFLRIPLLIVGALAVTVLVLNSFHRVLSAEGQGSPKVLFTGADRQESFILERPGFLPASKRVQPSAEQTPTSAPGFDGVFVLTVSEPQGESFSGKKVEFSIGDLAAAESVEWQPGVVQLLDLTASGWQDPSPVRADDLPHLIHPSAPPHIIVGTAAVNGSRVPEGTMITAWFDGEAIPGATAEVMAAPGEGASVSEQAAKTLEPLGDNLVRVWRFNPPTQSWSFFDPRPDLAAFNTITEFDPRQFYIVGVKEDQSVTLDGHNFDFFAGWNAVGGRGGEPVNTPTPRPTPTTSPTPAPVPEAPVVDFHAEATETKPGQPVDVSLAVVNLKTNPDIEVHVILRSPSGLLLAGDLCPSVAQCSDAYELSSGATNNTSVRATAKDPGQFTMEAQVTWQAKDGKSAQLKESLALTVVESVEGETEVTLHATQT